MTKQELIKNIHRSNKVYISVAILWIVLFFGVLSFNAFFLAKKMDEASLSIQIFYVVLFFAFLLVQIPLHRWFRKHTLKRFHLMCPHCKKPLEVDIIHIAATTGNCGHCGKRIVDEESDEKSRAFSN